MTPRFCATVWVALVIATILSVAYAQDEAEWLAAHNAARSDVSVDPLVWNASAAAYALNWVETQTARADCPVLEHSPDSIYGENIAYAPSSNSSPTTVVTNVWVAEKKLWDYNTKTCTGASWKECGHFTQVVWNTTTSVGCASAACVANANFTYYVCEYYPPGNAGGGTVPPY
ncbi:hypothetical protein KC19_8G194600 [Ceratodon purpureus]|uniref:SCP domain-containing protein n=1 Tax=Ceratodon purpureus TaxID=3225 RepID=A0A8T0H517_CERPU|nr:hypothetical protein KC19_8G194600 [Ceratodon purpureus]